MYGVNSSRASSVRCLETKSGTRLNSEQFRLKPTPLLPIGHGQLFSWSTTVLRNWVSIRRLLFPYVGVCRCSCRIYWRRDNLASMIKGAILKQYQYIVTTALDIDPIGEKLAIGSPGPGLVIFNERSPVNSSTFHCGK